MMLLAVRRDYSRSAASTLECSVYVMSETLVKQIVVDRKIDLEVQGWNDHSIVQQVWLPAMGIQNMTMVPF